MVIGGEMLKLSTGKYMPVVGLGTWLLSPDEVRGALAWALDSGYRLIDTAHIYGNEAVIGEVLAEYINGGKITRNDIFVTTKLWCTHNHPDYMEEQMKQSLANLKLEYVDLYLVHMPASFDRDLLILMPDLKVEDIWKGLESLFDKGYTRAIGVSNFSLEQIKRVQKIARIPVHNVQNECHLYLPQNDIIDFSKENNITFTSYASIGSAGRLSIRNPKVKASWPIVPIMMDEVVVKKLATKHGKTPAQILLRYLMQRGLAVIPKSTNESRIKENFDVFDFQLSDEDMKLLADIKTRARMFYQDVMIGHPEYPFRGETHPDHGKLM